MSNFTLDIFSELTGAFETVKSTVNSVKTSSAQKNGKSHRTPMGNPMAGADVQDCQPDGTAQRCPAADKKAFHQAVRAKHPVGRAEKENRERRAQLRNAFVMAEVLSPPISRKRHTHKSMLRRGGGNL